MLSVKQILSVYRRSSADMGETGFTHQTLNENPYNLKFTYNVGSTSIQYLDLTLSGSVDTGIVSSPYRKSTAKNTTLLATSCHPKHVIHNVPLGEFINCSKNTTFTTAERKVCERLRSRKYPEWTLKRARQRVSHINREKLLTDKIHNSRIRESTVTFSATYSLQYSQITQSIKKYLPILSAEESLHKTLKNLVCFVSRRAPTIGDRVSPSMFTETQSRDTCLKCTGFYRCGHNQCIACNHAHVINTFTSCNTGESHQVRQYINCNTRYVVYLITCKVCNIQYVGCTTTALKTRIKRHLSDVNRTLAVGLSMVSRHCQQIHGGSTSSIIFSGIEKVSRPLRGSDLRKKLLNRETFCIYHLNTWSPNGLNIKQDRMYIY